MWDLFEGKYIQYNLCRNNLLKLPSTKTCKHGTQALKGVFCGIKFKFILKI